MNKIQATRILTNYNQPVYGFTTGDITNAINYVRTTTLSTEDKWLLAAATKAEQWLNSPYKNINFNSYDN